jgi:hypothetical protein
MSRPSDLLHLVYSYFRRRVPDDDVPPDVSSAQQARSLTAVTGTTVTGQWRRATYYRKNADMRFRPRNFEQNQVWTILDMDIVGGTLYIPRLMVNTNTLTLLHNLMALEEQEKERPVTAYCLFMSQLACTAEDVQLLKDAGILQQFMATDEEAAKAFADLCRGVEMDMYSLEHNYLNVLWRHLHKRCSVEFYNFKGFFREKYCSTVFYRLAFCVVTLLFVSNVTQAIYAVIAYYTSPHPPS